LNYSTIGIANMALQRLGARGAIASIDEDSPNAIKVNAIWDMIFQEVLSERDWKFAKIRVALQQASVAPVYGYHYAYGLPSDFLRLVRPREIPQERCITDFNLIAGIGFWNGGLYYYRDMPVWPPEVAPYVVETILDSEGNANKYLLSDYPAPVHPVQITYIRLISDMTQLTPGFVNCLANRLAAELAIAITEDKAKAQAFAELYRETMSSAQAQLECDDYLQDEQGSQSWVNAGRYWGWR
jgi:hypothetical protein